MSIICHWCNGIGRILLTDDECTKTNESDCFSCGGIGFYDENDVLIALKIEEKTNAIERAIDRVEKRYFKSEQ